MYSDDFRTSEVILQVNYIANCNVYIHFNSMESFGALKLSGAIKNKDLHNKGGKKYLPVHDRIYCPL